MELASGGARIRGDHRFAIGGTLPKDDQRVNGGTCRGATEEHISTEPIDTCCCGLHQALYEKRFSSKLLLLLATDVPVLPLFLWPMIRN
jgi:hypothetical protein